MVSVREKGLLLHIIKHCKRIESKIQCVNRDEFFENDDLQEIVCFNIFQIGELDKRFSSDFISEHDGVPWDKIKGMRDIIAHGYGTIRLEDVYRTTIMDIELLELYCKEIINKKN